MKFNFDKHKEQKEEKPINPEAELTQEKFDELILKEAEKLRVSINQLMIEIDKFGGPEEFKKHFEATATTVDGKKINQAEFKLNQLDKNIKDNKKRGRGSAIATSVFGGISAICISLGITIPEADVLNLSMGGVAGFAALMGFIFLISEKLQARKENRALARKKGTEELKFKMTGTEIK
jgi:hypothetical protein